MLTHFNYQPLPCSLSARLRDSFYFGSLPKSLNRFFKRGARCNKRPPAVARTRLPGRCAHRAFYCQPLPPFFVRALAEILFKRAPRV